MDFAKNKIVREVSRVNEVFVSRKKPVQVYVNRVRSLLDKGVKIVMVHGSGMAISHVITLVNLVKGHFQKVSVETSSVKVVDEVGGEHKMRLIPGVHVQLIIK